MSTPSLSNAPTWLKPHEMKGKNGSLLFIYVQPGASRTQIKGVHGDRLKISVQSPPVDGAANEAVIDFLAKTLGVSPSRLTLVSGATSRQKNVFVEGESPTSVAIRISP